MAFQQITSDEIAIGKPIDNSLLLKIKTNDETFNASDAIHDNSISALSAIVNLTDDALVGATIYTLKDTAPRGYISAMGVSIGKASATYVGSDYFNLYSTLWNLAVTTAGQPYYISAVKGATALADWDAGKTITIDESGLFTRAFKSGITNGVGQKQDDAFQGHRHNNNSGSSQRIGIQGSAYWYVLNGGSSQFVTDPISDGTNGTPRTSNETRPVNVAKYIFIRYSNKLIP
jgi:hypothetical protein